MGQCLTKLDPGAGDDSVGLLVSAGEPANVLAGGKHCANARLAFRTEIFETSFRQLTHILKHARAVPRDERSVRWPDETNAKRLHWASFSCR
jgi:hypothetical protein